LWIIVCLFVLLLLTTVLSVLLQLMASGYHCTVYPSSTYGLWLPLYCLSFFNLWPLVTTVLSILLQPMASGYHCTVCPSSTYGLWLPLYCLSFFNLWPLVTTVLSVLLQLMASCYHFGIFKLFSLNSNITLMWIFF
jgi:hypothetical protein